MPEEDPPAEAEPPQDPASTDPLAAEVEAMRNAHNSLKEEVERVRDQLLRARADYENFSKRAQRETQEAVMRAKADILLRIIEATESLSKGIELLEIKEAETAGLRLVLTGLQKTLADQGVEAIEADQQPFDYKIHLAADRVETDDVAPDHVLDTIQRGYRMAGRVLRPAMVRVAASPRPPADDGSEE